MTAAPMLVLLATSLLLVQADLYLHSPPGSNNRNRERKDNRNNANRLFDSQNNGKGGYPWRGNPTFIGPDPLVYYVGSKLRVEWTVQHGCGQNPNLHCELVIQYACNDTLPAVRDGYPSRNQADGGDCWDSSNNNNQNGAPNVACNTQTTWAARRFRVNTNEGTNTIPTGRSNDFYMATDSANDGIEYGMHENYDFYRTCETTSRNTRLYTSDQKLKGNSAKYTRQNPNGGRRGLECPEERDYYPYWRPQPWRDIAVLVSNITYCQHYQETSQNVNDVGYCDCTSASNNNLCPISQAGCAAKGYTWRTRSALGGGAPECHYHPFSRNNHLGNTIQVDDDGEPTAESQPETAHFDWIIPEEAKNKQCVLRLRYNMSTKDYDNHAFAEPNTVSIGFDSSYNCPYVTVDTSCRDQNGNPDCNAASSGVEPACYSALTSSSVPLQNRPYVNLFEEDILSGDGFKLGLAINTHQTGRTFQDRSYVFEVQDKPPNYDGGSILNLGLRGRRGNIVQAYPAVEYDFTPSEAEVTEGNYIHIQFHGSDFNAAKNANNGEGWKFSDRTNMVEISDRHKNIPEYQTAETCSDSDLFTSIEMKKLFAWVQQDPTDSTGCLNIQNYDQNPNDQNTYKNCGKLNRAPNRFPQDHSQGLVKFSKSGTYYYMSTRNNNFSNRAQKAQIIVNPGDPGEDARVAEARNIGIAFAVVFALGFTGAGVFTVAKAKGWWCFESKGTPVAQGSHNII
uniref:Uncharacterized protein n=1 Tax=Lotharella globosa TaxID=91324 RepID=A0A7S3YVQ7_9EUKA|mmetsp:Transcript_15325/g.31089  ORF Transcript_15325/g.31089 Transcript_15325/m.31089 type:complete len:735 (+) Transcript_15325:46-2250(+)